MTFFNSVHKLISKFNFRINSETMPFATRDWLNIIYFSFVQCIHHFFTLFRFLALVPSVVCLYSPALTPPVFHMCTSCLSSLHLSLRFHHFLSSADPSGWSSKGNSESEWDLKERKALSSHRQGRPSLDWNAPRGKKNTTFIFSSLHLSAFFLRLSLLSCLISHFCCLSVGAWI